MRTNRRNFIKNTLLGGLTAASWPLLSSSNSGIQPPAYPQLDEILKRPVFKKELFTTPVTIESLELLHSDSDNSYLCRVRSADGAEGLSVCHPFRQQVLVPIFVHNLQAIFIGKDARNLEAVLDEVYLENYKLQGLALWIPLAAIELAILDMMGHIANKPIGQLIGEIHNPKVSVYVPNNNRGHSAKESVERIRKNVEGSNAQALKIKLGGRMHRPESPAGRSENLIPLVRKVFGDEWILYADANSSYSSVDDAIHIGKMLEDNGYRFFEEPAPFDAYEKTRQVAQALAIPIAGGEQESSLNHFRWLIANDALQVVQPDQLYFGGMIRSMKVARMAAAFQKNCTPHVSHGGLGYLYMLHFVSAIPNPGQHIEAYRDNTGVPVESKTSSLVPDQDGKIKVPTGPGLGVDINPDWVAKHQVISSLC